MNLQRNVTERFKVLSSSKRERKKGASRFVGKLVVVADSTWSVGKLESQEKEENMYDAKKKFNLHYCFFVLRVSKPRDVFLQTPQGTR